MIRKRKPGKGRHCVYQPKLRKEAKRIAKMRFGERFLEPMLAVLTCFLPSIVLTVLLQAGLLAGGMQLILILAIYGLVQVLVFGPLFYGLMRYCIDRLHGGPQGVMDLFTVFSNGAGYLRAVKMFVCIVVRAIPWMIVPFGALYGFLQYSIWQDPTVGADADKLMQLIAQAYLLFELVLLPFKAKILRYLAGYILLVRDPKLGPWKATGQAAKLFRGRWGELIVFFISFIGWQIFGIYTVGIGMLFYGAYLLLSFVWYAERLLDGETPPVVPPQMDDTPPR